MYGETYRTTFSISLSRSSHAGSGLFPGLSLVLKPLTGHFDVRPAARPGQTRRFKIASHFSIRQPIATIMACKRHAGVGDWHRVAPRWTRIMAKHTFGNNRAKLFNSPRVDDYDSRVGPLFGQIKVLRTPIRIDKLQCPSN